MWAASALAKAGWWRVAGEPASALPSCCAVASYQAVAHAASTRSAAAGSPGRHAAARNRLNAASKDVSLPQSNPPAYAASTGAAAGAAMMAPTAEGGRPGVECRKRATVAAASSVGGARGGALEGLDVKVRLLSSCGVGGWGVVGVRRGVEKTTKTRGQRSRFPLFLCLHRPTQSSYLQLCGCHTSVEKRQAAAPQPNQRPSLLYSPASRRSARARVARGRCRWHPHHATWRGERGRAGGGRAFFVLSTLNEKHCFCGAALDLLPFLLIRL